MEGSQIRKVFLVASKRTPIGSYLGSLSGLSATDLGAIAVKAAIESIGLDPKLVEEVVLGNVVSAGLGQAPARQVALKAGLPTSVCCTTINKVCSSGMKSIMYAAQSIALGQASVVVAGGFESMSNAPFYVTNVHQVRIQHRKGHAFGDQKLVDAVALDGLTDPASKFAMGKCA